MVASISSRKICPRVLFGVNLLVIAELQLK
jgi:hypothetical protein